MQRVLHPFIRNTGIDHTNGSCHGCCAKTHMQIGTEHEEIELIRFVFRRSIRKESHMNTTVSRVERSLRSAIDIGFERGSLSQQFSQKPTNRQFIEFLLRETE